MVVYNVSNKNYIVVNDLKINFERKISDVSQSDK